MNTYEKESLQKQICLFDIPNAENVLIDPGFPCHELTMSHSSIPEKK